MGNEKTGATRTVEDLTEEECRALLREVQASVRAGVAQESSGEVGDLVVEDLRKAGLDVSADEDEA